MAGAAADDWWRQSKDELETARLCKANGRITQAYLHAGQSIEFLIKAIIIKRNNHKTLPDCYKGARWHDLEICAQEARVKSDINGAPRGVKLNWCTAARF